MPRHEPVEGGKQAFGDPGGDYLDTSNPAAWGTLPGSVITNNQAYTRTMEFGIRFSF